MHLHILSLHLLLSCKVIEESTTLVAVHNGGWCSCSVGSDGKPGGTRGGEPGGVGTNNNGSGHTRLVLGTVRCSLDLGDGVGSDGGIGWLKLAGNIVHGLSLWSGRPPCWSSKSNSGGGVA
jgi:hypothetical protein